MNRFLQRLLSVVAASFVLAGAAQGAAAANMAATPDIFVRDVSNEVLEAIRADKQLAAGDPARVQKLVDDKILPYTDFVRMTQLAAGRGWRQATPEQRQQLITEFRILLMRVYSGALSQVRDHKVELKPFRAQPTDTDVIVRSALVASRGEPIPLDYRLTKTDAGWKIYDVNVAGVWLVENYRTQFAQAINAGGIDGLIKQLADRNRALEAAAKKG
ncbi:MAG: ABC transporter substrate-binding protein [Burkholderiaceae bacterium]